MVDFLDECVDLEEHHFQDGYNEGVKEGKALGRDEGRVLGLQKGFQMGYELGFYAGCVHMWQQVDAAYPESLLPSESTLLGGKVRKAISALEKSLKEFPFKNPRDGHLQAKMDSIRSKFKLVVSMLKIRDPYDEPNNDQESVMEKKGGDGGIAKGFLGGQSSPLDF
eukprot:jgi/Picsp_1/3217/NSC_06057-R1_protein